MNDLPKTDSSLLPAGACDTHIHFYDARFPPSPDALLFPPNASPEDYRTLQAEIGTERLVIVQPTTYGLDNSCQLEAMAAFAREARGVAVVDERTPENELERLTELGVCGSRFHMLPGGVVPWDHLERVANRIAPFGWHVQLQLNGRELDQHRDRLLDLPVDVVIDHVGRFMPPASVSHPSFRALCDLLDTGRGWVKLSAPYESSVTGAPHFADVTVLVDALVAHVPERLLWASNWPHPGQTKPPTAPELTRQLERWLPDDHVRQLVLTDNPTELYGF
jgi:D-galactarolactone isomerase